MTILRSNFRTLPAGIRVASAPATFLRHGLLRAPPHVGLQKGDFKLDTDVIPKKGAPKIRCPHCRWQPLRTSRWYCLPCGHPEHFAGGCGTAWNTFDTRGICPGCSYRWRHTSCLACSRWSAHDDWYAEDSGQRHDPG